METYLIIFNILNGLFPTSFSFFSSNFYPIKIEDHKIRTRTGSLSSLITWPPSRSFKFEQSWNTNRIKYFVLSKIVSLNRSSQKTSDTWVQGKVKEKRIIKNDTKFRSYRLLAKYNDAQDTSLICTSCTIE